VPQVLEQRSVEVLAEFEWLQEPVEGDTPEQVQTGGGA